MSRRHINQHRAGHGAPIWSVDEKAELLRLHKQKVTRAEIARRLGKTKNAVIGQLDRLIRQDKPLGRPKQKRGGRTPHLVHAIEQGKSLTSWLPVRKPKPTEAPKPKPLPPSAPLAAPKSIVQLGRRHCRWIGERPDLITLDTPIYCGAPTDGGSWCPEHRKRVFAPRPPVRIA